MSGGEHKRERARDDVEGDEGRSADERKNGVRTIVAVIGKTREGDSTGRRIRETLKGISPFQPRLILRLEERCWVKNGRKRVHLRRVMILEVCRNLENYMCLLTVGSSPGRFSWLMRRLQTG